MKHFGMVQKSAYPVTCIDLYSWSTHHWKIHSIHYIVYGRCCIGLSFHCWQMSPRSKTFHLGKQNSPVLNRYHHYQPCAEREGGVERGRKMEEGRWRRRRREKERGGSKYSYKEQASTKTLWYILHVKRGRGRKRGKGVNTATKNKSVQTLHVNNTTCNMCANTKNRLSRKQFGSNSMYSTL